jgi:transcriptional regulator with XRE-family HTH domain
MRRKEALDAGLPIFVAEYCDLRYCYLRTEILQIAMSKMKGSGWPGTEGFEMKLGEKIRYLREVEGSLRGMGRAINQQELVRLIEAETGGKLSQSYLSQIESGARPHMTNTTRQTLASFFKVHPGYLVDDPEGYHPELQSDAWAIPDLEAKLDLWLVAGAEKFRQDAVLKHALLTLARHEQSRDCLLLLESILETPGLMPRLLEVLRPAAAGSEDEVEAAAEVSRGRNGSKGTTARARKAPKRRKVVEG